MRVYFVGSHSTGKTTMARYVARTYDIPILTEVARKVLAEMETPLEKLRTDVAAVNTYQRRVFARQLSIEDEYQTGSFVSDRAFDNLAYAAEHTQILPELVAMPKFEEYVHRVAKGTVFFLRPHPELIAHDGTRENPYWEGVVRIDGMVKILLELYKIPYLPISTPNMQERCKTVDFVLKSLQGPVD